MINKILLPRYSANDSLIKILELSCKNKSLVKKNQVILLLETSKSNIELESQYDGFILYNCKVGDELAPGTKLATVYNSLYDIELHTNNNKSKFNSFNKQKQNNVDTATSIKDNNIIKDKDHKPIFSNSAKYLIKKFNIDKFNFKHNSLVTKYEVDHLINIDDNNNFNKCCNVVSDRKTDTNLYDKNVRKEFDTINKKEFPLLTSNKVNFSKKEEIRSYSHSNNSFSSNISILFDSKILRRYLKKISFLNSQIFSYLMYVYVKIIKKYPKFTAFYDDNLNKIIFYNKVNLGIAIDLGKGLKVIVVRNADSLSLLKFHESIINLICKYHDNRLHPLDVNDSTVMVSDLSNENIMSFSPLIKSYQSTILGIGGDLQTSLLNFNIVFDHRILTGIEVASVVNEFRDQLTDYNKLIDFMSKI